MKKEIKTLKQFKEQVTIMMDIAERKGEKLKWIIVTGKFYARLQEMATNYYTPGHEYHSVYGIPIQVIDDIFFVIDK